jgi:hypothetical protein
MAAPAHQLDGTATLSKAGVLGKRQAAGGSVSERFGEWFLRENAHDSNLLGDVSVVDFCGEAAKDPQKRGKELVELTPPFCDNVMLWGLVPEMWCEKKRSGLRPAVALSTRSRLTRACAARFVASSFTRREARASR